jgi:hypothetical protein
MTYHHNVRLSDRGKSPQLPAFCRTRRPITAADMEAAQRTLAAV